jgi:hypothetical protein
MRPLANSIWAAATVPVVIGLLISIVRDLMAGRMGVDAIALLSMAGALALGENLAAVVVAVHVCGRQRAGGLRGGARPSATLSPWSTARHRIALSPARRDHRRYPVEQVAIGDTILVLAAR